MAKQKKQWKLVAVGVAFKRTPEGPKIMTNLRKVQNPEYDPLYDNTWEAMGETVEPGEDMITALIRGFREECGVPDFKPLEIYGAEEVTWSTGKGDTIQYLEPLCYLHGMGPPQPWTGPVFAVEVALNFEPNFDASDGEAIAVKWWDPVELRHEIKYHPKNFMGWHMPAFDKLCVKLLTKKL